MSPAAPFGPWSPGVDPVERVAQLRSLAGLAAVFCGSHHPLVAELRAAENGGSLSFYKSALVAEGRARA